MGPEHQADGDVAEMPGSPDATRERHDENRCG